MNRTQYAWYLLGRLSEAFAVLVGAGLLADLLQHAGILRPPTFRFLSSLSSAHPGIGASLRRAAWWTWPAAFSALTHVLLGPKQTRPIYRRLPGAMYSYAGIAVDRNAGCRGGYTTGATGSGKTLACILPRLHSLCVNEAGVEKPGWRRSAPGRAHAHLLRRRLHLLAERRRVQDDVESADVAPEITDTQPGLNEREARRIEEALILHRKERYDGFPWGGLICGEKGNEWQMIEALLEHHGRPEDLRLLQTRPLGKPRTWRPQVRFNLLSVDAIPADTYAKLIVETALCVEEADRPDEFFVPQARDKIAWGLRLMRSVRQASPKSVPNPGTVAEPNLLTLLDVLTVPESYREYLQLATRQIPALAQSPEFNEARFQLENNYWTQPPDQLGGVRSTVQNFLSPFIEPEIAQVFCSDSTFELRDVEQGAVLCLAIPQKFALQRRYVSTLLKSLVYHIILQRFDICKDRNDWRARNVIMVEQDEWQRHAVKADCEADVVRETRGAIYTASQSQNAVWAKLGGRDAASPLIGNLRNRWICQAATEECADESSNLISGRLTREVTYSTAAGSRTTNVSFPERPYVPKRELRSLRPFHVIFAPAEGPWLYRTCIAMPATPNGDIPAWWFGTWNPVRWTAHLLALPQSTAGVRLHPGGECIPPWRACAPWRAQLRWLMGLDGTFIILGGVRVGRSVQDT